MITRLACDFLLVASMMVWASAVHASSEKAPEGVESERAIFVFDAQSPVAQELLTLNIW